MEVTAVDYQLKQRIEANLVTEKVDVVKAPELLEED